MTRPDCHMLSTIRSVHVQFDQPSPVRKMVMCNMTYMYIHYLVTGTSDESDTNVVASLYDMQVCQTPVCLRIL